MPHVSEFLTDDHRRCDPLIADAENAASDGRWPEAAASFASFRGALEAHLRMEEEVLFPRLEATRGGPFGPTIVMRAEHVQMRAALAQMAGELAAQSGAAFLGCSDSLMILIQQHNMKEERILYPMADNALGGDGAAVVECMKKLGA